MRLAGLSQRLQKRFTLLRDKRGSSDPIKLQVRRSHLTSPTNVSERNLCRVWNQLCNRRFRRIPVPEEALLPILFEKDAAIRDSGTRYSTGAFPCLRQVLRDNLGSTAYNG